MSVNPRVKIVVRTAAVTAVISIFIVSYFFAPTPVDLPWLKAFFTLVALSLASTLMALTISEGGATSSLDFVPQLAAVLLVGPAGAAWVALLSELVAEFFFYKKPTSKKIFNVSQMVVSAAAAALVFTLFNGHYGLSELDFRANFPPFILAILTYFAINTGSVSYVVSVTKQQRFVATWRQMTGGLIVFDLTMSLLGFFAAVLYLRIGPIALGFAVIPLIGLRYSYGVNYELKLLNTDLLRLLVRTIEAQDPYTSGHSIRVAEHSKRIAIRMGLGSKMARVIETAALLHDIGKIDVIYSKILKQQGPLTDEQREIIRIHPDRGVDILRSVRSLDPQVLACVRHHHERFDGQGYPAGLKGETIPLGARVIMVADTVDAMLTARPYRDALPLNVVREEVERHSGTQFDPRVVEAALLVSPFSKPDAEEIVLDEQSVLA